MTRMSISDEAAQRAICSASMSAPEAPAPASSTRRRMLSAPTKRDIAIHREGGDIVEQSSEEIWQAVAGSGARRREGGRGRARPDRRHRLRRDLLARRPRRRRRAAARGRSRPARPQHHRLDGPPRRSTRPNGSTPATRRPANTWADASRPRWRRRNCSGSRRTGRDVFDAAWQFFDLTDFLTWRATGSLARSVCTVTCKWTYLAHEDRWDDELFPAGRPGRAGRRGLRPDRHRGRRARHRPWAGPDRTGRAQISGSRRARRSLPGLIDAHAGGIGTVGAQAAAARRRTSPMSSAPRPAR